MLIAILEHPEIRRRFYFVQSAKPPDMHITYVPVLGHVNVVNLWLKKKIGWSTNNVTAMKAHNIITLKVIMDTPMNRLKFMDFAFVKSGRDKWSSMKLEALQELTPPNDVQYLVRTLNGASQDLTVALRWYQRGLTDVEKLVRWSK